MASRLRGHDDQVSRPSLAEEVARRIDARIAEEGLTPGTSLGTKASLREEFGIAAATMTETIRLLISRGLVTVRPGQKGGVFVAERPALVRLGHKMLELSGEAVPVADALAVRRALDDLVAIEAARHCTGPDVADLRRLAEAMAEDLEPAEYMRRNWDLHRRMALIGPNEVLRHTYISLLDFVASRVQGVSFTLPSAEARDGARIHLELVEAIAQGDPERLQEINRQHAALTGATRS